MKPRPASDDLTIAERVGRLEQNGANARWIIGAFFGIALSSAAFIAREVIEHGAEIPQLQEQMRRHEMTPGHLETVASMRTVEARLESVMANQERILEALQVRQ